MIDSREYSFCGNVRAREQLVLRLALILGINNLAHNTRTLPSPMAMYIHLQYSITRTLSQNGTLPEINQYQ